MFASTRKSKSVKYGVDWEPLSLLGGVCSLCTKQFSTLELRRHCRLCGKVVCGTCQYSERLSLVEGESAKTVCEPCGQKWTCEGTSSPDQCKLIALARACSEQEEVAAAAHEAAVVANSAPLADDQSRDQQVQHDAADSRIRKASDEADNTIVDASQLGEDIRTSEGSTTPNELGEMSTATETYSEDSTPGAQSSIQAVGDSPCMDQVTVPSAAVRAELNEAFGEQVVDQMLDTSVMQKRVAWVTSVLQQRVPLAEAIQPNLKMEAAVDSRRRAKTTGASSPSNSSALSTPRSQEGACSVGEEEFLEVADANAEDIEKLRASAAALEAAAEELRIAMVSFQGNRVGDLPRRRVSEDDVESLRVFARSTFDDGSADGRLEAVLQQINFNRAEAESERKHSLKAAFRRYSGLVSDLLSGRVLIQPIVGDQADQGTEA